jgi:hypothetical protein
MRAKAGGLWASEPVLLQAEVAGPWAWEPVPPHACLAQSELPAAERAIDELADEWVERSARG